MLDSWPVLEPFLSADKMINIPIAKHHSLTGASLGMKNWYGILGGSRQRLHQHIHESLVDLADFMRPTLTIIDAYRVLLRNGPSGGNPADVALKKTLIAGTDPVMLDAYAAKAYWDLDWQYPPLFEAGQRAPFGNGGFRDRPHPLCDAVNASHWGARALLAKHAMKFRRCFNVQPRGCIIEGPERGSVALAPRRSWQRRVR